MKYTVKSKRTTAIHYQAGCRDCTWDDASDGKTTPAQVRISARRHVEVTGHTVWVESLYVNYYSKGKKI